MESLLQDLRYGVRTLWKNRSFTFIAVIALALGIGANAAIFSVVNTVLLKPLPYKDPDRLVMVWDTNPSIQLEVDYFPISAANFVDWRDRNHVFEHMSILDSGNVNLIGDGDPERVGCAVVSPDFFKVMNVEPKLGRGFLDGEDKEGANKVVVISDGLWQSRFGADPNAVGKTINIDQKTYEVIGVAPSGFKFPQATDAPSYMGLPERVDLWMPMTFAEDFLSKRGNHNLAAIARLRSDVTISQAQAEMSSIVRALEEQYPDTNTGYGVRVISLKDQIVGDVKTPLYVLLGAVGFVLLIACANTANLLLARSSARRKEIAVRTALGASRMRVVRQLLTESVLLALIGGALGVMLNFWMIDLLLALSPENIPRLKEVNTDFAVLFFTLALSIVTGLLFGLAPALQAVRLNFNELLKEGSKGNAGGAHRNRTLKMLAASEVALSLVLLAGAGLMIKSFMLLVRVDLGFNPKNLSAVEIPLQGDQYGEPAKQIGFYRQTLDRIKAIPGVESAALTSALPLSRTENIGGFEIEGRPPADPSKTPTADMRLITPDYFRAMEIPVLKGRAFNNSDNENSTRVMLISESFARRYFPNEDPIGKRIQRGAKPVLYEIVGIVGDVKHTSLENEVRPHMYMVYHQRPHNYMTFVIRSSRDRADLGAAVRREIAAVDKNQATGPIKSMDEYLSDSLAQRRFNMTLLGIFAFMAALLAAVGIYGVISYAAAQRTQEIGIRIALGAQHSDVIRLVVVQGMKPAVAGILVGLAATYFLTRLMSSLLYGVSATDPLTFAAVALGLAAIALAACWIPARRAAKVDPMVALRCE